MTEAEEDEAERRKDAENDAKLNQDPEVKPYLLGESGRPWRDPDGPLVVDAIIDRWGHRLCVQCSDDVMPRNWSAGLGNDHHPKALQAWSKKPERPRVYWFTRRITPEERARVHAYLSAPGCTLERHAFGERQVLERAEAALEAARIARDEIAARAPGWSIKTKDGLEP